MEFDLKKHSVDLGIKLGTFLFFVTAVIYVIDLKLFANPFIMLAFMLPTLAVSIYSVLSARKIQNQIITFKEAFIAYFLCVAIGYLIVTIGIIVIFKFIDPVAADLVHEELMVFTKHGLEIMQANQKDIDILMESMQNNHSYSYMAIFQNYVNALLRNAIFGLFVALIFKKS